MRTKSSFSLSDVQLSPHVILQDVLYAPQFCFNLLSVSALTIDTQFVLHFSHDHFLIQDPHHKRMIGKGNKQEDLYVLDIDTFVVSVLTGSSQPVVPQNSSIPINHVSTQLWHNRLGHLSSKVLDVLKSHLSLSPCK